VLEILTTAPVIAPHFHVPLQSGSDRVLRLHAAAVHGAMYRRVVERLAGRDSAAWAWAPTSIAGFPGRDDADFAATLDLVEALPFSYLHVFPYSARRGTEAAGRGGAQWTPARSPSGRAGCASRRRTGRRVSAGVWSAGRRTCWCWRRATAPPAICRPHGQLRRGDRSRARSTDAPPRPRARDAPRRRRRRGRLEEAA
jgi:hypothetical protein